MSCTSTGAISHFTRDSRPGAECVHSSLKERAGVKRGLTCYFVPAVAVCSPLQRLKGQGLQA